MMKKEFSNSNNRAIQMLEYDPPYVLAIDQGTSSTRAIIFDAKARPVVRHEIELRQIYPTNGWVEHDPNEIWQATLHCCRSTLQGLILDKVAAIGITNQRETTVLWDRKTGEPLHNAIVWQDRRTAERCQLLKEAGLEAKTSESTGLLLDSYFSATKLQWLLDHIPGARSRAEKGELAFGTIDSFLIYKLTGGRIHATDVTNASRTLLFNLKTLSWDHNLLEIFKIPDKLLPEIRHSSGDFGLCDKKIFGKEIPIAGVAGDQQSALFGQSCFSPGDVKSTYGTGCFILVNTGNKIPLSKSKLLTTCAYQVQDQTAYAIEGSIFIAGAVVQWLRDALGLIHSATEIEALAQTAKPAEGLYFVPAFTGLGAPYWNPNARGAILGLTRDMGAAEIARAALDSVCYQTRDLLNAIKADMAEVGLGTLNTLKVDGGMVNNNSFCQRLADLTGLPVQRPKVTETTALGAAYLAGLSIGLFKDLSSISAAWALDCSFEPQMSAGQQSALYEGWTKAVQKINS